MAKQRAFVVYDEVGRIVSIGRPSEGVAAVKLGGEGQSVLETEIDEDEVNALMNGYVDIQRRAIVPESS
ncbi:hypothetical protein [Nocardia bovistercoris]|uniref:Uncharacterized protein n=1 Tax=Nocardia bovistercoris TaxID=2785916 RepID=A0A931ID17_9NOCA|nr:hypothetical protein [Nocardia bovistercoris]MBH0779427.1 hypothetical protein [Nocardia bovistercoris]